MPGSCLMQNHTLQRGKRHLRIHAPVPRSYVKVHRGFDHLYFGFFTPGTAEEEEVADEAFAALEGKKGALIAVSDECFGALAGVRVIGAPAPLLKPTTLTNRQFELMLRMRREGAVEVMLGPPLQTYKTLEKRGLVATVDKRWGLTEAGVALIKRRNVLDVSAP